MDEPLLSSRDRVGDGEEILTYCARFCAATNSDKLSDSGALCVRWLCFLLARDRVPWGHEQWVHLSVEQLHA
jgi:hypothetical protein